jgi:hypothetical protein
MLAPNLDQKAVPHDGSRLLPRFIVRARGRLAQTPEARGSPEARTPRPAFGERGPHARHPRPVARLRSERDFRRFAQAHLRLYFPRLVSQGQLNPRIRALEPEWRALQSGLSGTLADPSEAYRMIDTSLVPARARAVRWSGELGEVPFEDRVGLRLQGGPGDEPRRSSHRLLLGVRSLRREAHRRGPHSGGSSRYRAAVGG